jgi:hypothetical protein
MYQQQRFEHIVVTRPDTAALMRRGPVVRGSTTLLPQRAPGTSGSSVGPRTGPGYAPRTDRCSRVPFPRRPTGHMDVSV